MPSRTWIPSPGAEGIFPQKILGKVALDGRGFKPIYFGKLHLSDGVFGGFFVALKRLFA